MSEKPLDSSMEAPEGRYANYFEVGHNAFEFVFNFGQKYDEDSAGVTHSRIITGPSYAKALYEMLGISLARYEKEFGALEPLKDDHGNP
jgi:hypothetical protein